MSALTRQDLDVLGHYAERGNRELYWNYLAQHAGSDGYGLLALGVVRNDNAPGQVANLYASMRASEQDRTMLESDWERFGVDLIRQDLERRQRHFDDGRPDLALNLPARDVQRAHDIAFANARIDPNAWTPRVLLEAARNGRGEAEVERIWSHMLDNDFLGVERMGNTLNDIRRNMPAGEAAGYIARLGLVRTMALSAGYSNTDPDTIGGPPLTYRYNQRDQSWVQISSGGGMNHVSEVRDARLLASLDDARAVRLHRQDMRDDFHPADPNRNLPITPSPRVIADSNEPLRAPDVELAQVSPSDANRIASMQEAPQRSNALASDHPLYQQAYAAISRRDAELGREPDAASRSIAAAGALLAARAGYERIDDIVFNVATDKLDAGERFFVLQGGRDDPAHLRESMPTREALAMTPEQQARELAQLEAVREQARAAHAHEPARQQAGPQLA